DFLIPRPFDPRLILTVAPAVAQAAIDSGVATRPFADIETYRRSLQSFVYTSGTVMQPVFAAAAEAGSKRIAYAEGEDDRVLRAAQVVVDERLATPILVGRPDVIAQNHQHDRAPSRRRHVSRPNWKGGQREKRKKPKVPLRQGKTLEKGGGH